MTDLSTSIRLAGTAVILRDGPEGLETLLLRRNAKLAFAGGAWVFPGVPLINPSWRLLALRNRQHEPRRCEKCTKNVG